MSLRKVASVLVGLGLVIGLMGAGVGASFTDSANAVANISVGTFGITISSSTAGAVVSNSNHTVTLTCSTIQSSAAGSCPLSFTVTTSGSMPATVTVASNGGSPAFAAPWSDLLVNPGAQTIAGNGGTYTYSGGIAWGTLGNTDLGTSHSVTYTISAVN